jgi:hypothetical protein
VDTGRMASLLTDTTLRRRPAATVDTTAARAATTVRAAVTMAVQAAATAAAAGTAKHFSPSENAVRNGRRYFLSQKSEVRSQK